MLKHALPMKEIERLGAEAMRGLLQEIPLVTLNSLEVESCTQDRKVDLLASVDVAGEHHVLVCETKQSGQPRFVRDAIYQLRDYLRAFPKSATPVVIAPYLSPESRQLCLQNGVSFLDLEGNVRLVFGTVFIDRVRANKPSPELRELKSLFKPKSAQVLRVLFRDPKKSWKVVDLANAASVSLGHASNVRTALLNREWGEVAAEGLHLRAPDELLEAWKVAYVPPVAERLPFYTTLHGSLLESRVKEFFNSAPNNSRTALASFSAAQWIAPYGRTGTLFLWSEKMAMEDIKEKLQLSSSLKGENVVVSVPQDNSVFFDVDAPEYGIRCTSPLQTYLDLSKNGERGEEAAEHLRRMRLTWRK
jgi:Transcriptional regulator, AbiEi antitoxin, Type IV TA system